MLPRKGGEFLRRCMLSLFLLLCLSGLWLGWRQGEYSSLALAGAAVALGLSRRYLPRLMTKVATLGALRLWAVLTALCLLVKGAVVLLVRVPVEGDYAVFWGYAQQMSRWGMVYGGRYMALFPHIYGYSSFLSSCLRLFGEGELVAQWVNVALTACTGSFLFFLFRRNLPGAVFVYLLWILCPSQSLYNTLILSEPLYTALLAGLLWLVGEWAVGGLSVRRKTLTAITLGVLAGAGLRWVNMIRPVAAIPVIALLLWRLLLAGERAGNRQWTAFLPALLGVYLLSGPVADARVERMTAEPVAAMPGYSVLVGLNQDSGGRWNPEDSEALSLYSEKSDSTAQSVQEAMWEMARGRVTSGEIDYPTLLRAKLGEFLGRDDVCVSYCAAGLSHDLRFRVLCNGFWYYVLLLAAFGAAGMWRERERSHLLLAPLYALGLTLAQLLVEVAGRYHYSMLPMLLVVGAYGLFLPEKGHIERKERV